MELVFVTDNTRQHNTFVKKLTNVGQFIATVEVADFFIDIDPIETNEHVEIISGQYVQVWLPSMDGPDQIVIDSDIYMSDAIDFLNTLPSETVLITGSKYPKLQDVSIYHKLDGVWHIQMAIQLDMSDGDSIKIY
jgi:hypothetical protein